ncbi:uncharacterized protein MKZ38_003265 [Zalerion maritima]|uniref:non-specific serine/threonine protein kinase n=1 Tax=Zalerion maritima TaxID=339359 RepID=A0AAD5RN56_9PEZI|nr:uncharacterized protein MKZ38_003265 [Zalerion maritima]
MDPHHQYTQHLQHLHQPPQPQQQQHNHQQWPTHHAQPHLHTAISSHFPHRTGNNTPVQSPGLFSPSQQRAAMSFPAGQHASSDPSTPAEGIGSPFLHPLQSHKVRETHSALVEKDSATGRKVINQYEVIEEIGRGVHGKVKLARVQDTHDNVAIKIIPRFSKTRRLGKVTAKSPVDKTKKEIAILKKVRHPNVVALLEVIDDPELKKIYMVLEHVELGEVIWRKKGLPHICQYERRRIEREMRGEVPTEEEEQYEELLERRQAIKEQKRAKMASNSQVTNLEHWSFESGAALDDDTDAEGLSRSASLRSISACGSGSRSASRTPSRVHSSISCSATSQPIETIEEGTTTGPAPAGNPAEALEGTMYGAYTEDAIMRARSPSMADSIISHMSSIDFNNPQSHDAFSDDYSYVPCFTLEQARATFRDTVLGLEYLHYQGIIHRDIKPANLLCSKDRRVKISDFGVSYFGRPIREGEPDDLVSESEAHDFDDELELAKTVGTPAFFAPELCYTDLDAPPPKISEQIDVWSLGVTLYCLIFARIPFLAEDEFQMFRKIATDEVYVPRRRLCPVDPATSPSGTSLYRRVNSVPYRDDNELAYEEIDDLLYDLLKRMLVKNPEKRIRLHEVKRHPWVVMGIPDHDLLKWIDETDPRRQAQGQRIQVDERDMSYAVIPLTLLERAKSAVKKTYHKVMHGRVEGPSRQRATSSVASSAGDSTPQTPHPRDLRRRSIKPDDYFSSARDPSQAADHPLSQSETVSPEATPTETVIQSFEPVGVQPRRHPGLEISTDCNSRSDATADRSTSASAMSAKAFQRHGYARSITNALLSLAPSFHESEEQQQDDLEQRTQPPSPQSDSPGVDAFATVRKARDTRTSPDDNSRARSVDRGLFYSEDKHTEPCLALSTAFAPGSLQFRRPRPMRSIELGKTATAQQALPSPLFFSPRALSGYHGHPKSDPNMHDRQEQFLDGRPMTAHRIEDIPEGQIVQSHHHNFSAPESYTTITGLESAPSSRRESDDSNSHSDFDQSRRDTVSSVEDDAVFDNASQPTRQSTIGTVKSSSTNSIGAMTSPMTSPTAMTSPICAPTKVNSDSMLVFQSDPSLPALLSGASSVSADAEGEFLKRPGVVDQSAMSETTDSLTPPAIIKERSTGFPLDQALECHGIPMHMDSQQSLRRSIISPKLPVHRTIGADDGESDSESDSGFLMMGSKGKKKHHAREYGTSRIYAARRRDTNASIGSTETAKKIGPDGE